MKIRKSITKTIALLAALLLLSGCAYGIEDPIGDLPNAEDFAPYLSLEEADALFGASTFTQFDGTYLYYIDEMPGKQGIPQSNNPPLMIYRYNCETGETSLACMDSTCSHSLKSGCPFARLIRNGAPAVIDGKLVYLTSEDTTLFDQPHHIGDALNIYDLTTMERKIISYESADVYEVIGDGIYYHVTEYEEDPEHPGMVSGDVKQIWRYDIPTGTAAMVNKDPHLEFEVFLRDGRETVMIPRWIPTEEDVTREELWLYAVDGLTGEVSLLWQKPLSGYVSGIAGDYILFVEYNRYWYDEDIADEEVKYTRRLLNYVTGEDILLYQAPRDPLQPQFLLNDGALLTFEPDPDNGSARILRHRDLSTGKETVYPLESQWCALNFYYYRGRLYGDRAFLLSEAEKPDTDVFKMKKKDFVEWDICTGKQRILDGNEVFLPENDLQD